MLAYFSSGTFLSFLLLQVLPTHQLELMLRFISAIACFKYFKIFLPSLKIFIFKKALSFKKAIVNSSFVRNYVKLLSTWTTGHATSLNSQHYWAEKWNSWLPTQKNTLPDSVLHNKWRASRAEPYRCGEVWVGGVAQGRKWKVSVQKYEN